MDKRIKISIIYPIDIFGSKIGGIETFIKGFIKYSPEDFDIEIVGITEDKNLRPVGKRMELNYCGKTFKNYPVLFVPDPNRRTLVPLGLKFVICAIRYFIKNSDHRMLEFHRMEPALPYCFRTNKKILFVHTNMQTMYNVHNETRWRHLTFGYFLLEKMIINRMERVFVVCRDGIEYYKKIYPNLHNLFSFVPTWVDNDVFYALNNKVKIKQKQIFCHNHNINAEMKLILFVGRLEGAKNPFLLLKTFKKIKQKHDKVKLIIIGTGSMKKELEKLSCRLEIQDDILFLNNKPQNEVADVMRISDVFLLTSAFEGMPRCVLESLACGLPVVTTDVGEVKAVVREFSGIVVKTEHANDLSDAVLKIFGEPYNYKSECCIESVLPYSAQTILDMVYKYYYDANRNLEDI